MPVDCHIDCIRPKSKLNAILVVEKEVRNFYFAMKSSNRIRRYLGSFASHLQILLL